MHIYMVDSQDDVEHRGHHLEREIECGSLLFGRFHEKDQLVLGMLAGCLLPAAPGFEVCTVVSVDSAKKDDDWRFADDTHGQMKAGSLYISNNYLTVWLRDDQHRAHRKLRFMFLKAVYEMVGKPPQYVQGRIGKDIADLMLQNIQVQNERLETIAGELKELREEQELSLIQYAQLASFR